MSSSTAQDPTWKSKEQAEEARFIRHKEQAQIAAIREQMKKDEENTSSSQFQAQNRDFEGGFGGQEDLEDRYATTSGEH